MSNPKYIQNELEKKFDHLVEECGEFISAYGKMRRWGAFSSNPELDSSIQELNIEWVMRELRDITEAADRIKDILYFQDDTDEQLEKAFPLYHE